MKRNYKILGILFLIFLSAVVITAIVITVVLVKKKDNDVHDEVQNKTRSSLERLRELMKGDTLGFQPLTAYIVPSDESRRQAFISGFTGSAGTVLVTQTEALLWTDGRYLEQAQNQLDENWKLVKDQGMIEWFISICKEGDRIGVDANLYSADQWRFLFLSIKFKGCILTGIKPNLIDLIWDDKPKPVSNPLIALDLKFSGIFADEKVKEVREKMKAVGAVVLVLTELDEIAYFLNLRGSDIKYESVFYSYVIVTVKDLFLFTNPSRITQEIRTHFDTNKISVVIKPYDDIFDTLEVLAEQAEGKVWISRMMSQALYALIPPNKMYQDTTPVLDMKAIKNSVEAQGMTNCHIQDGLGLVQYFAWLENELKNNRKVTEISGATKLEEFRSTKRYIQSLSFETISASGPSGSQIHYRPMEETNREITDKEMYMCDSGGQYLDGTTDVTRTWHFGTPTDYEKDCYTRVLKGQLSVSRLTFPKQYNAYSIEAIARKFLQEVGLDYTHGTSHGIGSFLFVHENLGNGQVLQPNMFLTNEPGYYEEKKFGIRIEDTMQVVKAPGVPNAFMEGDSFAFNTVTMCPIHTKLIKLDMLTEIERNQLNKYHKRVLDTLLPLLDKSDTLTRDWLKRETQPI